ncbi:BnaCnng61160D, partial [Brassica napus]
TDGKSPPSDSGDKSRWTTFLRYYSALETSSIIQRWWKLLLARVLPKFRTMASCLCSFSETLRSFYPVIVVVTWWWMRNRARLRLHGGETEVHLRESIKERDERIAQLLHQIVQMSELLIEKKHSN